MLRKTAEKESSFLIFATNLMYQGTFFGHVYSWYGQNHAKSSLKALVVVLPKERCLPPGITKEG